MPTYLKILFQSLLLNNNPEANSGGGGGGVDTSITTTTAEPETTTTAEPETKQPETKQPETKQPETTTAEPETKTQEPDKATTVGDYVDTQTGSDHGQPKPETTTTVEPETTTAADKDDTKEPKVSEELQLIIEDTKASLITSANVHPLLKDTLPTNLKELKTYLESNQFSQINDKLHLSEKVTKTPAETPPTEVGKETKTEPNKPATFNDITSNDRAELSRLISGSFK